MMSNVTRNQQTLSLYANTFNIIKDCLREYTTRYVEEEANFSIMDKVSFKCK